MIRRVRRGPSPVWLVLLAAAAIGGALWGLPHLDLGGVRRVEAPESTTAGSPHGLGTEGCTILRVVDGDTVRITCPGRTNFRARLVGFDTPEVFHYGCRSELAAGQRATRALEAQIAAAKRITFVFQGPDRYGRELTILYLDDRNIATTMIEAGLARPYDGGRRPGWC